MADQRVSGGDVIGYVWPKKTRCPHCVCTLWVAAGTSHGGSIQYRRCAGCQEVYRVGATHAHVDFGGDQSEIVCLA